MAPRKKRRSRRSPSSPSPAGPPLTPTPRAARGGSLKAPDSDYADPGADAVLTLRGSLSPATRREYDKVLRGSPLSREDAWHRAVEFLFERLAVRWTIAGAPPIERQRDLLGRLRMATPREREWVRDVLRRHCAENFPDVEAP